MKLPYQTENDMMNKMLLATVSAVAMIGAAAVPALAQDAKVTIVKPDGTTVEQTQSTTESAGEAVEGAAEATGEAIEDTAEATGEAVQDAADATAEAAGDATRRTGEAAEDAAEVTVETTRDAAETTERAVEGEERVTVRTTGEFDPANIETTVPSGSYLSTELTDEAVQTPDGENIADTEAFVITPDGQITHVVIGFGGFLGLGEKRVMLPWNAFAISGDENALFTINLTAEQVETMPEFEAPDRDPQEAAAPAATERAPAAN